jgi:hypothetical protein
VGFESLAHRFDLGGAAFHNFRQNSPVKFGRRVYSQKMKDSRGDIDIGAGNDARLATAKIGTGDDKCIVDVEFAERRVAALAGDTLGIRDDVAGNAETIRCRVPAQRHHHIGGIGGVRADELKRERALEFFARENDAGELGALKPFDEASSYIAIVLDDIKQD